MRYIPVFVLIYFFVGFLFVLCGALFGNMQHSVFGQTTPSIAFFSDRDLEEHIEEGVLENTVYVQIDSVEQDSDAVSLFYNDEALERSDYRCSYTNTLGGYYRCSFNTRNKESGVLEVRYVNDTVDIRDTLTLVRQYNRRTIPDDCDFGSTRHIILVDIEFVTDLPDECILREPLTHISLPDLNTLPFSWTDLFQADIELDVLNLNSVEAIPDNFTFPSTIGVLFLEGLDQRIPESVTFPQTGSVYFSSDAGLGDQTFSRNLEIFIDGENQESQFRPDTFTISGGGSSDALNSALLGAAASAAAGGLACVAADILPSFAGILKVPVTDSGNTRKECTLDAIVATIKKEAIRTITNDIIEWANGGFYGQPSFLANPERFFENISLLLQSEAIDSLGLGGLCTANLGIDLRFTLQTRLGRTTEGPEIGCTFEDLKRNILNARFTINNKDFREIELEDIFEISTNNSSFNEILRIQGLIENDASEAETEVRGYTEGGTFSRFESCDSFRNFVEGRAKENDEEAGVADISELLFWKKCDLQATAQEQIDSLARAVDAELGDLALSDEITEILAAVVNGLFVRLEGEIRSGRGVRVVRTSSSPSSTISSSTTSSSPPSSTTSSEDSDSSTTPSRVSTPSGVFNPSRLFTPVSIPSDIIQDPELLEALSDIGFTESDTGHSVTEGTFFTSLQKTQILPSRIAFPSWGCTRTSGGIGCSNDDSRTVRVGRAAPQDSNFRKWFPNTASIGNRAGGYVLVSKLEDALNKDADHLNTVLRDINRNKAILEQGIAVRNLYGGQIGNNGLGHAFPLYAISSQTLSSMTFRGVLESSVCSLLPEDDLQAYEQDTGYSRTITYQNREYRPTGCTLKDIVDAIETFYPQLSRQSAQSEISTHPITTTLEQFGLYIESMIHSGTAHYSNPYSCGDSTCYRKIEVSFDSVESSLRQFYGNACERNSDKQYKSHMFLIPTSSCREIFVEALRSTEDI